MQLSSSPVSPTIHSTAHPSSTGTPRFGQLRIDIPRHSVSVLTKDHPEFVAGATEVILPDGQILYPVKPETPREHPGSLVTQNLENYAHAALTLPEARFYNDQKPEKLIVNQLLTAVSDDTSPFLNTIFPEQLRYSANLFKVVSPLNYPKKEGIPLEQYLKEQGLKWETLRQTVGSVLNMFIWHWPRPEMFKTEANNEIIMTPPRSKALIPIDYQA